MQIPSPSFLCYEFGDLTTRVPTSYLCFNLGTTVGFSQYTACSSSLELPSALQQRDTFYQLANSWHALHGGPKHNAVSLFSNSLLAYAIADHTIHGKFRLFPFLFLILFSSIFHLRTSFLHSLLLSTFSSSLPFSFFFFIIQSFIRFFFQFSVFLSALLHIFTYIFVSCCSSCLPQLYIHSVYHLQSPSSIFPITCYSFSPTHLNLLPFFLIVQIAPFHHFNVIIKKASSSHTLRHKIKNTH